LGRRIKRALARRRVTGLWPDYWIAPCASFDTPGIARHSTLFLSGHAPCDGSLSVLVDNRILTTTSLRAEHPLNIEFPSPRSGRVQLRFSTSIVDSQRRRVSFYLHSTNLIEEADLL
jgi:hypothetical protein